MGRNMSEFAGIEKKVKQGTRYFIFEDGLMLTGTVIKLLDNGMAAVEWSDDSKTEEHVVSIRERIDFINKGSSK